MVTLRTYGRRRVMEDRVYDCRFKPDAWKGRALVDAETNARMAAMCRTQNVVNTLRMFGLLRPEPGSGR